MVGGVTTTRTVLTGHSLNLHASPQDSSAVNHLGSVDYKVHCWPWQVVGENERCPLFPLVFGGIWILWNIWEDATWARVTVVFPTSQGHFTSRRRSTSQSRLEAWRTSLECMVAVFKLPLGKDTAVEIMSFLICSPKNMLSEIPDQGSVIYIS